MLSIFCFHRRTAASPLAATAPINKMRKVSQSPLVLSTSSANRPPRCVRTRTTKVSTTYTYTHTHIMVIQTVKTELGNFFQSIQSLILYLCVWGGVYHQTPIRPPQKRVGRTNNSRKILAEKNTMVSITTSGSSLGVDDSLISHPNISMASGCSSYTDFQVNHPPRVQKCEF